MVGLGSGTAGMVKGVAVLTLVMELAVLSWWCCGGGRFGWQRCSGQGGQ